MVVVAHDVRRAEDGGYFGFRVILQRIGSQHKTRIGERHVVVEHGNLGSRTVFAPDGGQHVLFIGQRTALEVVSQVVEAVVVQAVRRELGSAVDHPHMLAQHGQLRHAVVVEVIAIHEQRISLFHVHIAEGLHRIDGLINQGAVAIDVHAVVPQFDGTDQNLDIGADTVVGPCLVGIKQVDPGLLLFRLLFPVLCTEQTDAKQA